jgi:hypothetical protein
VVSGSCLRGCPQGVANPNRDKWSGGVAWLSTGGEGVGGDRPVAVGPLPGTADDPRAGLHRNAADEADARLWELETRAARSLGVVSVASVTFAAYAAGWLAGFIDDAPDRGARARPRTWTGGSGC